MIHYPSVAAVSVNWCEHGHDLAHNKLLIEKGGVMGHRAHLEQLLTSNAVGWGWERIWPVVT